MKFIAIDPGKTTGYALFDSEGKVTEFNEIKGPDKFLDWLEDYCDGPEKPEIMIIERYRNRGGFVNSFSDMPTSQHIGAITRVARKRKIEIVHQDPSPALVIGLKFLGLYTTYKGKHVPDKISALAHGTYFLKKAGVLKN